MGATNGRIIWGSFVKTIIFALKLTLFMDKLIKCIWIANTIADRRDAGITLKELNDRWTRDDDNDPIPERSFHNYRQYIADVFGIDIECDKSRNAYYIPQGEREEMLGNDLKMWLLHSFAINNRLSSDFSLRNRVQFERVPGGIEHLELLMEALQKSFEIEMRYRRYYGTDDIKDYHCKPLALKLFKQRWYLIALNERDETRCYALDRIDTLSLTETTFKVPEDFDLQTYFQDAFGIYVEPDLKTEEILIKADKDQSNFLKGLPLHHSQCIIEETDDYSIFSWRLKPSYDFIQQLLTMNAHIEVLEPISLREKMKGLLQEMLGKY